MSRTRNRFLAALAILSLFAVQTASAGTMRLGVNSSLSQVTVSLNVLSGLLNLGLGTATLSGPQPPVPPTVPFPNNLGYLGDVVAGANVPVQLTNYGAGAAGNSLALSTGNIPFVGSLSVGLNVPVFDIETGVWLPSSASSGMATFDFSGVNLGIKAGDFTYSGSGLVLGIIGSGTINFGSSILNGDLAPGTTAKLTLGAGPPSNQLVTLEVPINTTANVLPGLIGFGLSGRVVFTGVRIPEPSTMALGLVALLSMAPTVVRRVRRRG